MTKQEIFEQINTHLLNDAKPSIYLNTLLENETFQKAPYRMLYLLNETEQSPQYHPEGNAWVHTMMVVDEAAKVREKSERPREFMWAAFLHDIGKPETTMVRKGRITSYGHDEVGEMYAKELLEQLNCDKEFIHDVSSLVRYHMHILYVLKNLKYGNVKKMLESVPVKEVALLGFCDRMGRTNACLEEEKRNIEKFYHMLMKK